MIKTQFGTKIKHFRSPMLMGGDFNVTLEAKDRPNIAGGQDLDSEDFRPFITEEMLQEMGPVNCVYTWRSMNRYTLPSCLDRFLCSTELAKQFPLADVHSLPRPLSDHTSIVWTANVGQRQFTYFNVDRSSVREVPFKEEVERAWSSQASQGSSTKRLADKIIGLRGTLRSLGSAYERKGAKRGKRLLL